MKETSITAYQESQTTAEKHRIIIMSVLNKENKPMSSLQISIKCNLEWSQVWKRLSELERDGKICDSGFKAKNPSGKNAIMFKVNKPELNFNE